ncbi:hypothetical protein DAERI_060120 [Deinococcus aerius]|uniref:Uncharacterized protein n=1 Tax=Deinococcus aerius TaxID=200253 RepID=A0A2I9D628_9DEIO|nr:hypothetical protein [Deinococcus aerius]GBF05860.1 hypothetical protein DAERI_060120 [Deinococcus aerius]
MAPPPRRDWPVMLAQRMRASNWVNAQVQLVGTVETYNPDPLSLLNILGVYEVDNRSLRLARMVFLTEGERERVMAYLLRHDELVEQTDQEGRRFWKPVPPAMRDGEREAFAALWRGLAKMGALRRLPPRPKPDSERAPAPE